MTILDKEKVTDEDIEQIFARFERVNPAPKIELNYVNHFTLLVAIILSAQATDVSVNKITPQLFALADNPEQMIALGEEELIKIIRKIGLHRAKAKHIMAMSRRLVLHYGGAVPLYFEELLTLPGVGRKSANVLLNAVLGEKVMGVDTHVFRISNRIGLVDTSDVLSTENSLIKVIPDHWLGRAHNWLVLHGRYICKARKPLCSVCIINDLCKKNL